MTSQATLWLLMMRLIVSLSSVAPLQCTTRTFDLKSYLLNDIAMLRDCQARLVLTGLFHQITEGGCSTVVDISNHAMLLKLVHETTW